MHNRKSKDQNHWRVTLNEIHKDSQNERYFLGVRLYHVVLELFFFSFLLKPQRFFCCSCFMQKATPQKNRRFYTGLRYSGKKRDRQKRKTEERE